MAILDSLRRREGITWISVLRNTRKLIQREDFDAENVKEVALQLVDEFYPDVKKLDIDKLEALLELLQKWLPFILSLFS